MRLPPPPAFAGTSPREASCKDKSDIETFSVSVKFLSSDLGEVPAKAGGGGKRTLTNLYNQRPTWLDLAHKRLDEAVFAAYGWPSTLSDEEILEKLLALNLERSKAEI